MKIIWESLKRWFFGSVMPPIVCKLRGHLFITKKDNFFSTAKMDSYGKLSTWFKYQECRRCGKQHFIAK